MKKTYPDLVLTVAFTSRGLGYVVLEGPQAPVDWGIIRRDARNQATVAMQKVTALIDAFQPTVLVLEDIASKSNRHSACLKRLSLRLVHLGEMRGLATARFNRAAIRQAFKHVGAKTKAEIAEAVAMAIPAFAPFKPPLRKIWMSEDARQLLFDAAALGITYYSDASH